MVVTRSASHPSTLNSKGGGADAITNPKSYNKSVMVTTCLYLSFNNRAKSLDLSTVMGVFVHNDTEMMAAIPPTKTIWQQVCHRSCRMEML